MTMNKLPEGPNTHGLIQLMRWILDPLGYMEECFKCYGDVFTLKLTNFNPFVLICHPQGIQEIFAIDTKKFDSGKTNGIARPLVGDNSLILLDGDRHKQQRKLLTPPFHGERMFSYGETICEISKNTIKKLEINQSFEVRNTMQSITLEVIIQAVFGLKEGERYEQIKPLLAALLNMTDSPISSSLLFFNFLQTDLGSWSPWGKFIRRRKKIYQLLQDEINERRENNNFGEDILSLMMSATDENGQGMTDAELCDELMTLLAAGHETTATSLTWAFYWIHYLPEVKEKVLQELDNLGENYTPMDLFRLPYLTAVCQESLRMYPVVPISFPRISKEPVEIMGHQFDENTMLMPCTYLIHHREDLYTNSYQFKPERFIEKQYPGNEFMPFGGGNRRCIGYALAMFEMKLVLATILSEYQLDLVTRKAIKPARRGLTIAPGKAVNMLLKGKRMKPKKTNKELEILNN